MAFTVVYARASVRLTWLACLLIGWLAFVATAAVLYVLEPTVALSLAGLFAATVTGRRVLPPVEHPVAPAATPRGDLALRLLATAALVGVLTGVAQRLGPRLSGLLNASGVAGCLRPGA